MRLKGKTALVTAAGQGIGYASVMAMVAEGATVWATDINPTLLERFKGHDTIHTHVLDVMDKAAIKAFAAKIPAIDVLFNCAGFVHAGTVLEATDEDWNFAFDLNVRSQFWMIQAILPGMLAKKSGSIINMASIASSIRGLPNRFVYGATKAAVVGLTKAVAADYVTQGIRCNAVCPGTVDTPSLQDLKRPQFHRRAEGKQFIARQPMGRLATAEEIAPVVVFLASDGSTFSTGNLYSVDGGMTI